MEYYERNYVLAVAGIILAAVIALGIMEGVRFAALALLGVIVVMVAMWLVASWQRMD